LKEIEYASAENHPAPGSAILEPFCPACFNLLCWLREQKQQQ
jgi:hypothetical protein